MLWCEESKRTRLMGVFFLPGFKTRQEAVERVQDRDPGMDTFYQRRLGIRGALGNFYTQCSIGMPSYPCSQCHCSLSRYLTAPHPRDTQFPCEEKTGLHLILNSNPPSAVYEPQSSLPSKTFSLQGPTRERRLLLPHETCRGSISSTPDLTPTYFSLLMMPSTGPSSR